MNDATGGPRPRYGEYASPQEQRRRMGLPPEPVEAEDAAAPVAEAAPAAESGPAPDRRADRIATFVLLGYGLFTVLSRVPSYLDYASFAASLFDVLGIDATLSDPAAATRWSIAAGVVLLLGWGLAAWVSVRRLRTGRPTWWIPLVAGLMLNIVAGALLTVPLIEDPAVWSAIQSSVVTG